MLEKRECSKGHDVLWDTDDGDEVLVCDECEAEGDRRREDFEYRLRLERGQDE